MYKLTVHYMGNKEAIKPGFTVDKNVVRFQLSLPVFLFKKKFLEFFPVLNRECGQIWREPQSE